MSKKILALSFIVLISISAASRAMGQTDLGPGFYRPARSTEGKIDQAQKAEAEKQYQQTLGVLRRELNPEVLPTAELRKLAEAVESKLPMYEKLISDGLNRTAGLHIDAILEMHKDDGTGNFQVSQKRSRLILEHLNATTVGFEGSSLPEVTLRDMTKEVVASGVRIGLGDPSGDPETLVRERLEVLGSYQYAQTHKGVRLVGTESIELSDLMFVFQKNMETFPPGTLPEQWVLDVTDALYRIRSYLTMAILANNVRENGASGGVVVMGAWHGSDILRIMRGYGIKGRIYQTLDPEAIERYGVPLDP